jgi:hypothetical protein
MPQERHYYIHHYNKEILHSEHRLEEIPEGYEYCGMSQLPIKGAAGYYSKNQAGFKIIDADPKENSDGEQQDEKENSVDSV